MAIKVSQTLGSSLKPIGSDLWFPDVNNPNSSPIYASGDAQYLKTGNVIVGAEEQYPEAYELFGVADAIGTPTPETKGGMIKYTRIK